MGLVGLCYAERFMDWLEQARALAQRGEVGQAIAVLEQAVAMGDESAEICKELARLCLTVNEVRAFANYCHEAMRLDPGDGEPYLMMGRVLTARQRWGEVVEALEAALGAGALGDADRVEAEELLARARREHAAWQREHPGASNL
jgi:tetratricopeptide (TPR) repeat protein